MSVLYDLVRILVMDMSVEMPTILISSSVRCDCKVCLRKTFLTSFPRLLLRPVNQSLHPSFSPTALTVGIAMAQTGIRRVRLRGRAGILIAWDVTGFHPLLPLHCPLWRKRSACPDAKACAHCPWAVCCWAESQAACHSSPGSQGLMWPLKTLLHLSWEENG